MMHRMRFYSQPLVYLIILTLFLSSCAAAATPAPESLLGAYDKSYGGAPSAQLAPALEAPAPMPGSAELDSGYSRQAQTIERIVIQNGNITIVVADPAQSMETIKQMAKEMGGFVVSADLRNATLSNGSEVPRASITIRVPSEQIDEALRRIKAESSQPAVSETINSQDVTSEYVDLQSRLKNLEAAETELQKIMEEASRTEDVLAVYNQLVQIREQIETVKGQIKYYEQSAALSAISVELIVDEAIQPLQIGGWQPQGVAKNAVEALLKTFQGLSYILIWLVIYVLPILLVLFIIFGLPPLLLIRYLRRRSARKKSVNSTPPSTPGA